MFTVVRRSPYWGGEPRVGNGAYLAKIFGLSAGASMAQALAEVGDVLIGVLENLGPGGPSSLEKKGRK